MIVGPSGCGKTTLLSVMTGILNPSSGRVQLLGRDLASLSPSARTAFRRDQVGIVFQQFHLLAALTAVENVAVPLAAQGVPRREALRTARAMLSMVAIEEYAEFRSRELSAGQQQRVAIARALVHHPRLVVCDEPTSALDSETGNRIMRLLRRLALNEDRAVAVVTHDTRLFEFASHIAMLEDGRIVEERWP